ncbi:hypothetical protein [Streptomyces sp. WAC06614]|uniref:hypothetical protein n=1 Tax=Streptomyces sp. WAC06614 TaxID=2487416 RepID=UPI00163C2D37|nr:hypothetical protein [Streptomyces sp. WAC06614]
MREHARRLLAGAEALGWKGPEADAFRERVTELAGRCSRAATDLSRAAGQVADPGAARPGAAGTGGTRPGPAR